MRGKFCILPREISPISWDVACDWNWLRVLAINPDRMGEVSRGHSVRWAAHGSGGLKSLWFPDGGDHIQESGGNASQAPTQVGEGRVSAVRRNPKGMRRTAGL